MTSIFLVRRAKSRFANAMTIAALCFFGFNSYRVINSLVKVGSNLASGMLMYQSVNTDQIEINPSPSRVKRTQSGKIESIQINPNSTVSPDLQTIWHNPDEAKVCVRFKPEARCPHPSLVGRISGQSVAMLQWSQAALIESESTEYCGSYANSWIEPGIYFLEIIIIHCNGFGITALERIQSQRLHPDQNGSSIEEWLEFDFVHECLEDSLHSRLTAKNAFISMSRSLPGVKEYHVGHWVSNTKPRPHYTRHQPVGCNQKDRYWTLDKCQAAMNNSRIDELSFAWNRDQQWSRELEKLQFDYTPHFNFTYKPGLGWMSSKEFHDNLHNLQHKAVQEPPICFLGDSHSVRLWNSMLHLNLGHRFSLARRGTNPGDNPNLLFPDLTEAIDQTKWSYETFGCTTFVLAVGQWTSSHQAWNAKRKYGRPFSFGRFYRDMSAIVQSPKIHEIDPNINIILRTIHLNPLGVTKNECGEEHRPKDWRSPTVIDAYNHVIRQVVDDV